MKYHKIMTDPNLFKGINVYRFSLWSNRDHSDLYRIRKGDTIISEDKYLALQQDILKFKKNT